MRGEVKERTVSYMVAAFGLVAGLAWNDAIKALIEHYFPLESGTSIVAKFIYAFLVTIVIVVITTYLMRLSGGQKKK